MNTSLKVMVTGVTHRKLIMLSSEAFTIFRFGFFLFVGLDKFIVLISLLIVDRLWGMVADW